MAHWVEWSWVDVVVKWADGKFVTREERVVILAFRQILPRCRHVRAFPARRMFGNGSRSILKAILLRSRKILPQSHGGRSEVGAESISDV
jgi:hypothetical protein